MANEVGSILGYLRLDRSDWDAELTAAGVKADELARHSPNIKIGVNGPTAIAQLATVAAAVKRLQDAQGAEGVAEKRLADLRASGTGSAGQYAAAEERVARAHRGVAAATIGLAAAQDRNDQAIRKATEDTKTNAAASDKATFSYRLWLDTIAMFGPAIAPITAWAAGAAIGFAGLGATALLAFKGIQQEMQNGTMAGRQFTGGLGTLSTDLQNLEQVAAGGVLTGFQSSVTSLHAGLTSMTPVITQLSLQLGSIVSHTVGGLVPLLQKLQPLFLSVATMVDNLAAKFEHWAKTTGSVSNFVVYVQQQMPTVTHVISDLVVLVAHLVQSLAPLGGVALGSFGMIVHLLDAIPINVLQTLVPLVVDAYLAFRAYQALSVVGETLSALILRMRAFGTAASEESLAVRAAKAEEEASVAKANAEMAASTEGMSAEMIAAYRAAAIEAEIAAAGMRAAAIGAASTIVTEGEAAAVGWTAMLGPIGLVATAIGLLVTVFHHHDDSAQRAAAAAQKYAQSVKESTDSLNQANIAQTQKNLADDGSLLRLDKLTAANHSLGVSYLDLAMAVNGTGKQFVDVENKLASTFLSNAFGSQGAAAAKLIVTVGDLRKGLQDQIQTEIDAEKAAKQVADATQNLTAAQRAADDAAPVTKTSMQAIADAYQLTTSQVQNYATMVGLSAYQISIGNVSNKQLMDGLNLVQGAYDTATVSGTAFLAALSAFSSSAGTGADHAALLGAGLVAMQGDALSLASALASASSANQTLRETFEKQAADVKKGTIAFSESEKAAINLKTGLINVASAGAGPLIQQLQAMQTGAQQAAVALYQHELATRGAANASADAATIFKTDTYDALVKDAGALGLTRGQAEKLATQYFNMPKDFKTTAKLLGTSDVVSVLNQIGTQLSFLTGHPWISTIGVDTSGAIAKLDALAGKISGLGTSVAVSQGSKSQLFKPPVSVAHSAPHNVGQAGHSAYGGTIDGHADAGATVNGSGSSKSDSVFWRLSVGEEVIQEPYASQWRPVLKSINNGTFKMPTAQVSPAGSPAVDAAALAERVAGMVMAQLPARIVFEADKRAIAHISNNGNLALQRRS